MSGTHGTVKAFALQKSAAAVRAAGARRGLRFVSGSAHGASVADSAPFPAHCRD